MAFSLDEYGNAVSDPTSDPVSLGNGWMSVPANSNLSSQLPTTQGPNGTLLIRESDYAPFCRVRQVREAPAYRLRSLHQ